MPDNSPILALPYIQPSQAQKHVTHNAALTVLDVLAQLVVAGFGSTTPPADPVNGETHALGASPTDAWAGQGNALATWRDGVWHFIAPQAGWRAWGAGELRIWDGTAWALATFATDNLGGVGIGTAADTTNRLSVRSDATLLSHAGAGHQLKLNKNAATDTASLLLQSNWTGHAEMGLAGNNDFAVKVSADGATWHDAMRFDRASGKLAIASGGVELSGNQTGGEQQVIADDAVGLFTPPRPGGYAFISVSANTGFSLAHLSGLIYFDTGHSLLIDKNTGWVTIGARLDVVTTDVTGTTGVDGNVTVAAQLGVLKIENRGGSSTSFQVTFL